MQLYNINKPSELRSFQDAVQSPLGSEKGLFFPAKIPSLPKEVFEIQDFSEHSFQVLSHLVSSEIPKDALENLVKKAFSFPIKSVQLDEHSFVAELFHGPTLAFKDFGVRFLAQVLSYFSQDKPVTILTATSGDTGGAVAHAFAGMDNVKVVILYPKGKISVEQEQLFCTIGKNIKTIAVDSDFDDCQALVKASFDDQEINQAHNLNSGNSINIARIFGQVCYYSYLNTLCSSEINTVCVPSGNFGNITSGLIAKNMGAPIKHFIAATNSNDVVPRYLATGNWQPNNTIATLSNAMDISAPNNFPRVEKQIFNELLSSNNALSSHSVSEAETVEAIKILHKKGYTADPHTAVAYHALKSHSDSSGSNVILSTAHPAKFKDSVSAILNQEIELPEEISHAMEKPNLSIIMSNQFEALKEFMLDLA